VIGQHVGEYSPERPNSLSLAPKTASFSLQDAGTLDSVEISGPPIGNPSGETIAVKIVEESVRLQSVAQTQRRFFCRQQSPY
jgi:hypothetical protein